jgi:hypothetical protein
MCDSILVTEIPSENQALFNEGACSDDISLLAQQACQVSENYGHTIPVA